MWRITYVAVMAVLAAGAVQQRRSMKDLMFLTRDGCVNTPDLVVNLDDALRALDLANDYQYIDIGKLPSTDVRTGYPTPTILYQGKDIFGMSAPKPPYDIPG